MADFDREIALAPVEAPPIEAAITETWFRAQMSPDHWVVNGPNGGYLAAVLTHGVDRCLGDPGRQMRSLTVHYLRPPSAGDALVGVEVVRSGRSVAFCRVRLVQNGDVKLLATGAWGTGRGGLEHDRWSMPIVDGPPETCPTIDEVRQADPLPLHGQWDLRAARGRMFGGSSSAELAWWIRPRTPRLLDAPLVAAMTDAMPPPIFAVSTEAMAVPTLDLTVHIRAQLDQIGWQPGDWILARFVSRSASGGFIEEDGELWTADGTLVAHSRQLALAV